MPYPFYPNARLLNDLPEEEAQAVREAIDLMNYCDSYSSRLWGEQAELCDRLARTLANFPKSGVAVRNVLGGLAVVVAPLRQASEKSDEFCHDLQSALLEEKWLIQRGGDG